ncbi:MAG: hypothetical protein HY595_02440 [Candidatus Omnitrophica bacterium]|nr:hypothetical protein [Candidatus Omnitrophota bacterium]
MLVLFLSVLNTTEAAAWEARYKQIAELYIVKGVVKKAEPHAYVTLDIQDNQVLYKKIEDWKAKTVDEPGGVFTIVSEGTTPILKSLDARLDFNNRENVVRAFYAGGESVNFLIIGETFLLEVKNSVIAGNAANYMYYERVR